MAAMRTLMLLALLTSGCCESPHPRPPEGILPPQTDPTVELMRQLVDGIGSPYDEAHICRWCGSAETQEHARGCAWARAVMLVSR